MKRNTSTGTKALKSLLQTCVAGGRCEFMNYGSFGEKFDLGRFAPAWANRRALDTAAEACRSDPATGFLDLTLLLYSAKTGYPSSIDGRAFDPKSRTDRLRAQELAQEIIDKFGPGTPNPYAAR